jgi:hypothetical protein
MESIADIKTAKPESAPARSASPATARRHTYVGPQYTFGVVMPGEVEQISPRDFSDEEVDEFLARYPDYKRWWSAEAKK